MIRNMAKILSTLPCLIEFFLTMPWSPREQAFHDWVSGTLLVKR